MRRLRCRLPDPVSGNGRRGALAAAPDGLHRVPRLRPRLPDDRNSDATIAGRVSEKKTAGPLGRRLIVLNWRRALLAYESRWWLRLLERLTHDLVGADEDAAVLWRRPGDLDLHVI